VKLRATAVAAVCAAASVVAGASPIGCGSEKPPAAAGLSPSDPRWQDVFDTTPELLVVVRAKAAREDRVYGPLLKRALELARDQSRAVASTRAVDALSSAEELVAGLRPETQDHPAEMVLVARGVPASVDPAKLADDDGAPMWSPGPPGTARELVYEADAKGHPVGASLFELPGRTWVIATGPARRRAREAYAHPFGRPMLDLDPQALAIVRLDGPSLVQTVHALQDLGSLAAVGRHLRAVTLTLAPGAEHAAVPPTAGRQPEGLTRVLRAALAYDDDDSAAAAGVTALSRVAEWAHMRSPVMAWLGTAQVDHTPRVVTVTAKLPGQLVERLLHAGSAPLDEALPTPPP
jgi:hypothetical protein